MRLAAIVALTAFFFLGAAARAAAQMIDEPVAPAVALEINRNLAKLGYPVDPESDSITPDSQSAVFRIFLRLGRGYEDADLATIRATLAGLAEREEFPCPEISSEAEESAEFAQANVVFSSARPEEQLAAFYLRMAQCHPALLAPQAIAGGINIEPAPRKASTDMPAFPVHRTKRSVALFREAVAELTFKFNADNGPSIFIPGLRPEVADRTTYVTVSRAEGDYHNGIFKATSDAAPPQKSTVDAVCGQFAYGENCAEIEAVTDRSKSSDRIYAYDLVLQHFMIVLGVRVYDSHADEILTDAVDYVAGTMLAAGEDEIQARAIKYYRVGDAQQLAPTSEKFAKLVPGCMDKDTNSCRKNAADAFNDLEDFQTLAGWIPPASGSKKANTEEEIEIHIVDEKAFLKMEEAAVSLSGDCAKSSNSGYSGGGGMQKLECLAHSAYALLNNDEGGASKTDVRFIGESGSEYGHGVHTAHLASGAGIELQGLSEKKEWRGFGDDEAISTVAQSASSSENENAPNGTSPTSWWRQNSFLVHNFSMEPGTCYRDDADEMLKNAVFADKDEVQRTDYMLVFAQPYEKENDKKCGKLKDDCFFIQSFRMACLGAFSRGILVAPVDEYGSLITQVNDQEEEKIYQRPDALIPLLGAPGGGFKTNGNMTVNAGLVSFDADDAAKDAVLGVRTGSSVAAPIVSALVARVRGEYGTGLDTAFIKDWLFANSTPARQPEDNPESLIGIVNFARSLEGKPGKVNVWRPPDAEGVPCDDNVERFVNGQCRRNYDKLYVNSDFLQAIQEGGSMSPMPDSSSILAIFGDADSNDDNPQLGLLLKTDNTEPGKNNSQCNEESNRQPCHRYWRLHFNLSDLNGYQFGCAYRRPDADSGGTAPCICAGHEAQNGATRRVPIYLDEITHIVRLLRDNTIVNEGSGETSDYKDCQSG